MTVTIEEVQSRSIAGNTTETVSIVTDLVPSDLVVVVYVKVAATGAAMTISGLGTWSANTVFSGTGGFLIYKSLTGVTGAGDITLYSPLGSTCHAAVYVVRGLPVPVTDTSAGVVLLSAAATGTEYTPGTLYGQVGQAAIFAVYPYNAGSNIYSFPSASTLPDPVDWTEGLGSLKSTLLHTSVVMTSNGSVTPYISKTSGGNVTYLWRMVVLIGQPIQDRVVESYVETLDVPAATPRALVESYIETLDVPAVTPRALVESYVEVLSQSSFDIVTTGLSSVSINTSNSSMSENTTVGTSSVSVSSSSLAVSKVVTTGLSSVTISASSNTQEVLAGASSGLSDIDISTSSSSRSSSGTSGLASISILSSSRTEVELERVTTGLSPVGIITSSSVYMPLEYPVAIDVTFSIVGSTVTSIDTGVPVGTYDADGSQIDDTNTPYPVGTPIINDSDGHPQVAGDNVSPAPMVTVNSTQTWTVSEEVLRRESLVFNRPVSFGRFHQPINWTPVSTISNVWGKIQIIIDGKDVTYFRAHPTQMGPWSSNEPNGDAACSISFPQISWFERPGSSDLSWIDGGNDVDIVLHRQNGSQKTLFEGLIVGVSHDGQGIGVVLNVLGTLYQADHTPYIQELYLKNRDIGTAIADIMDGTISRHFLPCNRPATGIRTNIRGSGGARLTQSVQDLLATAFTADLINQWTITNYSGRRPRVILKDKTTKHWSMAIGHPGLSLSLANDFQQMIGMVWGSGVATDGGSWYNAKYPGIRVDEAPLFPLSVGTVFVAGDGHTGFDTLADEMRTRGYYMSSGDTYSSNDVAEIRDAQRKLGITIDGVVGAQTWAAIFGVGGSVPSLDGAHIAPLAAITENVQFLERLDGSIIGPNPRYDKSKLAIGRLVEYGEGVNKIEGTKFARGEIQPRILNDPMWVGSATLKMDPEEGSRWEIKAGQNLFAKFMYPPQKRIGLDDGLLLHISQASITPGGDASLQLSYLAHDMTTLAAIKRRNKETLDPARRGVQNRSSRITQDAIIPWDAEAGGGKVPLHNLQGGFWTVLRIPAGQIGRIVTTRYICSPDLWTWRQIVYSFNDQEDPLTQAKEFCIAIFSKPVTSNQIWNLVGDPLTNARIWTTKAVRLEKMGLVQAYGASDQPAGHWPGAGSEGDAITGKLYDGSSWEWESSSPPYLWVAEYCNESTRIAGQFRNAPLGSS